MIQHNTLSEQALNRISQVFSSLQVGQSLRKAGIRNHLAYRAWQFSNPFSNWSSKAKTCGAY
jgi:hypothetical protein